MAKRCRTHQKLNCASCENIARNASTYDADSYFFSVDAAADYSSPAVDSSCDTSSSDSSSSCGE